MGGSAGVGVLLLAAIHDRGRRGRRARALRPLHRRSRWRCSRPASGCTLSSAPVRRSLPPDRARARRREPPLRRLVRARRAPGRSVLSSRWSHDPVAVAPFALDALDDEEAARVRAAPRGLPARLRGRARALAASPRPRSRSPASCRPRASAGAEATRILEQARGERLSVASLPARRRSWTAPLVGGRRGRRRRCDRPRRLDRDAAERDEPVHERGCRTGRPRDHDGRSGRAGRGPGRQGRARRSRVPERPPARRTRSWVIARKTGSGPPVSSAAVTRASSSSRAASRAASVIAVTVETSGGAPQPTQTTLRRQTRSLRRERRLAHHRPARDGSRPRPPLRRGAARARLALRRRRRSASCTTATAASPTGSRCGSCATERSPRTRCRRPSSPSGARPARFLAEQGEAEHLDPHARPPPRGRPRPPRGAPPRRAARRASRQPHRRGDRRGGVAARAAAGRAGGAAQAPARPARGDRARLLRRLHAVASWPNGSASRWARSRAGCSPASRGCASCSPRPGSKAPTPRKDEGGLEAASRRSSMHSRR